MALFGNSNDICFFQNINNELINDIIETIVEIVQVSLYETDSNIYGESLNKVWKNPIKLACLIDQSPKDTNYENTIPDIEQLISFGFIKDDLKNQKLVLQESDLIHWNNEYWEVSRIEDTQYFMGRNPETNKDIGNTFGWDVSVVAFAHITKRNIPNLEQIRSGDNKQFN